MAANQVLPVMHQDFEANTECSIANNVVCEEPCDKLESQRMFVL